MPTLLQSGAKEFLRGGHRRSISFAEYMKLAGSGQQPPPFVVEEIVIPNLGENSWGCVIIREGATRTLPRFRR